MKSTFLEDEMHAFLSSCHKSFMANHKKLTFYNQKSVGTAFD
jgi:hypothetical protein